MGKAIVTWTEENEWQALEGCESESPQLVELHAVVMAFPHFLHIPLNVVIDCLCC